MTDSSLIKLRDISFCRSQSEPPILRGINLQAGAEQAGIIGPNGCGKTTLFRIMVGLTIPSSGKIYFKNRVLMSSKHFTDLRRETGFLFQESDDQLFSPTVLEDVAFGPLNIGYSAKEAADIALQTLESLGLTGFEDRISHKLSGGEKKLVALAAILAMRPKLLLLDEPTNDLDPKTKIRLIKVLTKLNMPMLVISHDWDFLTETTQKLYTIEAGGLQQCDKKYLHHHQHVHNYGNKTHKHSS